MGGDDETTMRRWNGGYVLHKSLGMLGWICTMAVSAMGQMTNLQAETNSIRLEWAAMPGNPYRVFATTNLVVPTWNNLTPDGVVFSEAQGFHVLPMGKRKEFCFAVASDYIIVDLLEGPDAANYSVSYTNAPPDGGWTDEYKTTKLVLRRIPGGHFTMGSPTNEYGRNSDEAQHSVRLTKDFYIGVFEVTQKQWERVMGNWPSLFSNVTCRDSRPVERVGYIDIRGAVAGTNWPTDRNVDTNSFLGRLRMKTGQVFDLPAEAQWEYACRAGTATALNSGFDMSIENANERMSEVGRFAGNHPGGYPVGSSTNGVESGTAKVGSYQPNTWGLFDMHGNVSEWCLDGYESDLTDACDPSGAVSSSIRVLRGGGWNVSSWSCRSASRSRDVQSGNGIGCGFRLAQPLP